jgi:hypothetical protein
MNMKNPNVVASIILAIGLVASSLIIARAINNFDTSFRNKNFPGGTSFPSEINFNDRSPLRIMVENFRVGQDVRPLVLQTSTNKVNR